MNIYQEAWKLLLERIKVKTGWGNVELQKLMLQCLIDAGDSIPYKLDEENNK